MSSVAPAVRRRKNLTASASMDENKLLRLARGEEGPAAAPRASLDTAPQSTEFEGGPPDVLAMKASNSRVSLFDSKSVGMMQKISSQVLEQFNMAPSTILLPVWAITFCGVYLLSNFTFKHFQIHVMIPERVHTLSATKLVEAIAVSLFGINGCLQLSSTMFQRLPKKRQLNSLVLFINFVPLVTYTCSLMEIFPKFRTPDGLPLEYLHITQWMFTTPTMIIIVSSLGTSMRKSLVFNWKMTLRCIMWDEITLINGLIMFLVPPPFHWIPLFFAICSYCKTLIAIHKIVHYACKNAGTSFEVNSIKTLEKITFVLWSVFPSLQVCQLLGIISFHEHRVFRVLGDVFVKTVYSVSILSGNFCLLDTISELRISQMRESQAESEDNFDRSEKLNEALKMQCVEADTTARMAKRFVANLSHELRTPLNSVIAFNSLLLESGLEPIHQEYVKSSLTSAEALLGIIGQVLDYSKLEHSVSQEVVVDAAPFDLNQVCDELLDVVVARVAARKVQFVFETWQPIPFLVGDKFRLRQVLINLADNAVKFSRDDNGVVILSITADQIDNGTLMVQIDVTDNGIGIPEKKRDLIFQPFSQVYSDLSRKYGGTGLGLVISKKIVEAMHGQIDFVSTEGQGTTFRMMIPFLTVPDVVPEYRIPAHNVPGGFKGSRAIVCMPESVVTTNLATRLEHWGMTVLDALVRTVSDDRVPNLQEVQKAIQVVKISLRDDPNLVAILDYPTLKVLYEDLMQREHSPSILVMGSFDEQVLAVHNAHVEVHRFVLSPMKHSALYAKLDTILHQPRTRAPVVSGTKANNPLPRSVLLPLARSIAVEGNGTVSCKSHMGSIYEDQPEASRDSTRPLQHVETTSSTRLNILIVEDHIVNQKVVFAMLNKVLQGNFDHKIANNGQEGFEAATAKGANFNLILMDIQMPILDGLSATKMIRDWEEEQIASRRKFFICAVTAHASQADRIDCFDVGMNRYMTKPLNLSSMKDIIAEYWAFSADCDDKEAKL